VTTAAERWAEQLAAWAIPEDILAAAPESPWLLPPSQFGVARRDSGPGSPTRTASAAVLEGGGTVLDVGAGGGAASLPLAPPADEVVAVDSSAEMLDAFAAAARERGVAHRTVLGRWPDVAADVGPADVAVCSHVAYNVPDIGPFLEALSAHARRRVVLELTAHHPLSPLNGLWRRFHGIERPTRPTADDLVAVLAEQGVRPDVVRWARPGRGRLTPDQRSELVAMTRRRLCLPPERDAEVAAALGDEGDDPVAVPRDVVTIWWAGRA
jgi:SAM-dependent methyltransferase